ncbi:MAG: hypothetical protein TREMPRED_002737, partial [Tremellales sp. Tagirdzhanova-0007]
MDPDRDFVVLTTPHIPLGLEEQLRREGATVERRELIRGMPGELDPYGSEQWKDQYSKLHVFNLTMYERILFLDSDMVINQPMQGIWEDQAAWPKSGLASTGGNNFDHPTPPLNDRDDFNGGFWLVRPSADLFETLLKVRGYNDWDKEQGLMNKFFNSKAQHPWEKLDHVWNVNYPNGADIDYGVHA